MKNQNGACHHNLPFSQAMWAKIPYASTPPATWSQNVVCESYVRRMRSRIKNERALSKLPKYSTSEAKSLRLWVRMGQPEAAC